MKLKTPSKPSQVWDAASEKSLHWLGGAGHQEAQPVKKGPHAAPTILLIDDDRTVRESLHHLLTDEGYRVLPAESGEQACDLISRSSAELVLLDLNMPAMNGWDTFEQLTRERPLLPIIVITARANQLFTALSAGAGALLEKPMNMSVLLDTVRKLLNETPEQRLARLVGRDPRFVFSPTPANLGKHS